MCDIKQKLKNDLEQFVIFIRNHYSENLCTENLLEEEDKLFKEIGFADIEKRERLVEIEIKKIEKSLDDKYNDIRIQLNSDTIIVSDEFFKLKNDFFKELDMIVPIVKTFVKEKFNWYIQPFSYYLKNKKDFDKFYHEYTNASKTLKNFNSITKEISDKLENIK